MNTSHSDPSTSPTSAPPLPLLLPKPPPPRSDDVRNLYRRRGASLSQQAAKLQRQTQLDVNTLGKGDVKVGNEKYPFHFQTYPHIHSFGHKSCNRKNKAAKINEMHSHLHG